MNRGLVLEFTKMHGAGNDFIVIDNRFFYFTSDELSAIARKYCTRHFGVGADGLLALETPRTEGHDFHMTYMNAWTREYSTSIRNDLRRIPGLGRSVRP